MASGRVKLQLFLVLLLGSLPSVSCQGTTPSSPAGGQSPGAIPTLFSSPPESPAAGAGQDATTEGQGPITRSKHLNPNVCGMFAHMRQMLGRQAQSTDITQSNTCQRLCQAGIAPSVCRCQYRANPCTVYRCPGGTGCTLEMCSDFLLPVCVPWSVLYQDLAASPDAVCNLPPDSGSCPGTLYTRYYFDQASASCMQFRYSGCGGNANSFTTLDSCRQACGRSRPMPPNTVTAARLSSSRPTTRANVNANTIANTNTNANSNPFANFMSALSNMANGGRTNANNVNNVNNNVNPASRMAQTVTTENPTARMLRTFNSIAARRSRNMQNTNANTAQARGNQGLTPWQLLMMGQSP